ncbi:DUF4870 domain-containing protein [Furfurilactobacillus siliginis]|nr:DUF4870 domain-containing protein [Furfurilactobacillus siliginis]GEK28924.1 hypothetical protein LSI01_12350 [Furfurilactobacillus siliginis]
MEHKVVNALSYFSILFLPVIFPLVVWIVGSGEQTITTNAKKAFWSQLLPTIMAFALFFFVAIYGLTNGANAGLGWLTGLFFGLLCLISVVLWFYNIVMGIRMLLA